MPFTATPAQLKVLKQAVDDYCGDCVIIDAEERLHVAELVSSMYNLGFTTPDDLRRGLEYSKGQSRQSALISRQ